MQARSVLPCLAAALSLLAGAQAFWDEGHMLVGAIATHYLNASGDLGPILEVLKGPDGISGYDAFHDLVDSSIWMDQIKCTSTASFCPLPAAPAFFGFSNWHYGGSCIAVNGYPETANPCPGTDRLDAGLLLTALADTIGTFSSTKSMAAAGMQVRIITHLMGDLHQPLHCAGGAVDQNFPMGDIGGNGRKFDSGCEYSNMHALWDSAANMWTTNWNPANYNETYAAIMKNASDIISSSAGMPETLGYDAVANVSYSEFTAAMKGNFGLFARTLGTLSDFSKNTAYKSGLNLNPKVPGGTITCPGADYKAMTQKASVKHVGLAGYRLAIVLSQLSRQIVKQGILNGTMAELYPAVDSFTAAAEYEQAESDVYRTLMKM